MKELSLLLALAILLAGCSPADQPVAESSTSVASNAADTVYINGKIYTVNDAQPWAEAVAIKDGAFLAVGTNADVHAVSDDNTTVVDLGGRMAMPGLVDLHNHAMGASMGKANLYFQNPNDREAILAEIKAYAEANPDLAFIRGEAWNLGVFPGNSPRKELLDEIVPNRPVYFYSQTGHDAWVNSVTLDLIGIDAESEQTTKLIWDVDPETNEPTGTIHEYAMTLVEQALGPTDAERIAPKLKETLGAFSERGFTSVKLAEGEPSWVRAANLLDEQGELDMRLFPSWFHRAHNGAMTAEESFAVAANWEEFRSERVYPRYVKMFADGSAGTYSSLLFEDYEGRPDFKGSIHFPTEEFAEDFTRFNKLGLGMIVHVFGDASSLEIIKAFEAVRERNGDNGIPLHFSHSFMTRPQEIQRLSEISDVCMDFMTLQYPHPAIREALTKPIGEERYQKWLNVKSAEDIGITYGFGSDWPATLEPELNGFFQMQGFVTRRDPRNPDSGTLNVSQAITLQQAVRGFTRGGAECLGFGWGDKLGSIEAGKLADFIVVDRNIFEIPIDVLNETQVDLTVVGGEVVYGRN